MPIKRINKFPEFRHIDVSCIPQYSDSSDLVPVSDDKELEQVIFAPDPITGIPRSDLGLIMSKDTAPEVSQYIRDHLMQPASTPQLLGSDDDSANLALASVKLTSQSFDDYAEGLRKLVSVDSGSSEDKK